MREQEEAEKNQQGTPWGGYASATGGPDAASGSEPHRPADAADRSGSHRPAWCRRPPADRSGSDRAAWSGPSADAAEAEAPRSGGYHLPELATRFGQKDERTSPQGVRTETWRIYLSALLP